MKVGRPPKKGLSYHGSDTDYYDDFKIMSLLDEYGPLGQTIYDVIIKMVYRNGYYLEIPMDKLALSVTKTIGSKWIRNKNLVLQVVQYCADIGLFDDALLQQSVITSVGIQKRYEIATVRNRVQKEKYWLLKEESGKPVLNAPKNSISDTKTIISDAEIQDNDAEIPIKESKENNIDNTAFSSPELEQAFQLYLLVRKANHGDIIPEQVQALRADLLSLSSNIDEQLAIVKKATSGGWKCFYDYKSSGKKTKDRKSAKKTGNNNFSGRDYDMDDLEKRLIE